VGAASRGHDPRGVWGLVMLARIICALLGHVLEDLVIREGEESYIYVGEGKCSRCHAQVIELALPEEPDTVDERPKQKRA